MDYLHLSGLAISFHDEIPTAKRLLSPLNVEVLAYPLSKSVAVFKCSRDKSGSISAIYELRHSFLWSFPKHTLIGRASGDINGSTPINSLSLFISSTIHGLKWTSRRQFIPLPTPSIESKHIRIGWNQSYESESRTPVKFCRNPPIILEIHHQPSVVFGIFRPDNVSYSAVWFADSDVGLFRPNEKQRY